MTRALIAIAAVAMGMLLAGCWRASPGPGVHMVADDDPRMNAAMEKAKATVDDFLAALRSPKPGQGAFSVKMGFPAEPDQVEYMWLGKVSYDGKLIHGTLDNEPRMAKDIKRGHQATLEPGKVDDWMYVDKGKLVGGYTIRVLRDAMSAEERADFDQHVPFKFD